MGVHKASPFLWKKEATNPLQAGCVYGVDVSTILYVILNSNNVYRSLTRKPVVSVKDLVATWLDDWFSAHQFRRLQTKFVFVFDGHELGLKKKRRELRAEHVERWTAQAEAATSWEQYDKSMQKLARVNGHLLLAFCDWVRVKLPPHMFCLFGAPFEADAQLVYLERAGFTHGTLTNDSDIYFLEGSRNMYSGFNTRSTRKYRSIIDRATVDPYFSSLRGEALRTLGCFMGTDYIQHLSGVGSLCGCVVVLCRRVS